MSVASVPRCQVHSKISFLDSNRHPSGEPSLMIRSSSMVKQFIFLINFTDMEVEVFYLCAPWLFSYQILLFSSSVFLYSDLIIYLLMPISGFLWTTEFQFQFSLPPILIFIPSCSSLVVWNFLTTVITKQPS